MVASSSAFFLPFPPAKGSSIDSDWSTRNRKQPGFLRLISAWYGMVFLHSWQSCSFLGAPLTGSVRPCTLFVRAKAGCDCGHLLMGRSAVAMTCTHDPFPPRSPERNPNLQGTV